MYATKNSEFVIRHKNVNFCYDFTDLENKKIIEFNGDVFHGNPKLFDKNDRPNPYSNEKAWFIWARDKGKMSIAKKHGFDTFVIWESDWRKNKDEVIKQIKEFYGEKNN